MIEVVRIGSATISIRDDLAERVIAVCLRCKGFGTLLKTDCYLFDPFYWFGYEIICPICGGKGLYHDQPS